MPTAPPRHRPNAPNSKQHRPPEADRQARRTLATNCAAWRRIRGAQLAREPMCRMCASKGITRQANQVDHIDGDASNNDPSNLQSLDARCHSRKTCMEDGGFGNRARNTAAESDGGADRPIVNTKLNRAIVKVKLNGVGV